MQREKKKGLLLSEALPSLTQELRHLLTEQGESQLAGQVPELKIVERCLCSDSFCASFYTQPKPQGGYGPDHRSIMLDPKEGMLILDVVAGKIVFVEVLFRYEVRQKLDVALP